MFQSYKDMDYGDGPQTEVAPKSAVFSPNGVDAFTALGKIKFLDIPERELYHFFADGRVTGLLMDQMLNSRYKNLSAMRNGANKGFDLYQNGGDGATPAKPLLWETKVWTKHGCDLAPSVMKGKGRTYDKDEFHANAKKLTGGFIVVDIRQFPAMKVFGITTAQHAALGHPRKITDDIFHRLIKGKVASTNKVVKEAAIDPKKYLTGSAKAGFTLAVPGAPVLTITNDDGVYVIREQGKKKPLASAAKLAAAKAEAIQIAQAKAVFPGVSKTPKKAATAKTPKAPAAKKAPAKKALAKKTAATKKPRAKKAA